MKVPEPDDFVLTSPDAVTLIVADYGIINIYGQFWNTNGYVIS